MDLTTIPQTTDERRRHPRRRVTSIVYVRLDDGNGGILLNLGIGGLSFQAVAGLRHDQDLVVNFGFFDTNEPITIAGRVAWLGPTRKEVGVSFKDLPNNTEESIARWIAQDDTASNSIKWVASDSPATPAAAGNEMEPSSPQLHAVPISSYDAPTEPLAQKSSLPSDSLLGPPRPRPSLGKSISPLAAEGSFPTPPTNAVHPQEYSVASPVPANQTEANAEPLQATFQVYPQNRSQHPDEWFPVDRVPPKSPATIPAVDTGIREKRRRRTLMVAVLASCFGLLVVILMAITFKTNPENAGSGAASAPAPGPSLPAPVGRAPNDVAGNPSAIPPPQVARPAEVTWLSILKRTLGFSDDDRAGLDAAALALAVWTDTRSGFYYCTDSPYFGKLQPGSSVTQGDALQNGYQPKLGSYCH